MGRKPTRDSQIKINLTEKEKEQIEELAEQKGLSASAYGRMNLLERIKVKQ